MKSPVELLKTLPRNEGRRMRLSLVTYLCGDVGQMPVGSLLLAEFARQRNWEVEVLDLPNIEDEEEFARRLSSRAMVGFSTICSSFHRSIRIAHAVKRRCRDTTVVMGGPQVTATAQITMERCQQVDMVFTGEAETGWQAFLDGVNLDQVPGLYYRNNNDVTNTPAAPLIEDLNSLPMPAYDLYPASRAGFAVPIEAGRGCPFRCTYCTTSTFFARRFRSKSPARVLAEMDRVNDLYGSTFFDFIQDTFSTSNKVLRSFCEAVTHHPRRYSWHVSARADHVDRDMATLLHSAGCRGIYYGLETGSQRMQRLIKKGLKVNKAVENIRTACKIGLSATVSFIFGFPEETPTDLDDTLRVYGELVADGDKSIQIHILSPLKNSELELAAKDLIFDGMATDFNETQHIRSAQDIDFFRSNKELFPHFFYFKNNNIPRDRCLFIFYVIRICSIIFINFLTYAFRWHSEEIRQLLITSTIPEEMKKDLFFPSPLNVWTDRVYKVIKEFPTKVKDHRLLDILNYDHAFGAAGTFNDTTPRIVSLPREFAGTSLGVRLPNVPEDWSETVLYQIRRRNGQTEVSPMASEPVIKKRIRDICTNCAECCLDCSGLLCGKDEWKVISDELVRRGKTAPMTVPAGWPNLVLAGSPRYLACDLEGRLSLHASRHAAARAANEGSVRLACSHLTLSEHGFFCDIHSIRPTGCVAYPFILVAQQSTISDTPIWSITLRMVDSHRAGRCRLAQELVADARLREAFTDTLAHQGANNESAFALAMLNHAAS